MRVQVSKIISSDTHVESEFMILYKNNLLINRFLCNFYNICFFNFFLGPANGGRASVPQQNFSEKGYDGN
jgi:hypothetical protein